MSKIKNPDALIRIGDVIKVLCREKCYPGPLCPDSYCTEMWNKFEDVERVDAVPVRHGRWIIKDNPGTGWYRVTCSECGEDVISVAPVIGFFPKAKVTWDFCPNCGARMDEKDGGND